MMEKPLRTIWIGIPDFESIEEAAALLETREERLAYLRNRVNNGFKEILNQQKNNNFRSCLLKGYGFAKGGSNEIEASIKSFGSEDEQHLFYIGYEYFKLEKKIKSLVVELTLKYNVDIQSPHHSNEEEKLSGRELLIKYHSQNGGRLTNDQIKEIAKIKKSDGSKRSEKNLENIYRAILSDL